MDKRIHGLELLASWIENKESGSYVDASMIGLSEEWHKAELETDAFFQQSDYLQSAFSQLKGRFENGQQSE